MKTLLIIGNGFDLNLNLKTSYQDFIKSQEFQDLRLSGDNALCNYLNQRYQLEKWVDVEDELGKYCTEVLYGVRVMSGDPRLTNFRKEYYEIREALKKYLSKETRKATTIHRPCSAIELLKELSDEEKKKEKEKSERLNAIESISVASFNYTDTVEWIAANKMTGIHADVLKVHGSLSDEIVFGVEDTVNLRKEHQFLYKSYSQKKKARDFNIRLTAADRVIFYGYSMGKTDHSYFSDYFSRLSDGSQNSKELVFYYFGETDRNDIMWELRTITGSKYNQLELYNSVKWRSSEFYMSYQD